MRAIILAAGRSQRMRPLTDRIPKCLLPIGTMKILEYQIDLLRENGVSDIVIVNGFAADEVEKVAGSEITYVYNGDYLMTNSLFSLFLAREYMNTDVVLLNSDIIVSRGLIKLLVEEKFPNAVLVDFNKKLIDGEMNVKVADGFVAEISKEIPGTLADGESVQLCKFSGKSAVVVRDEIDSIVNAKQLSHFPAYAFRKVIGDEGLVAVDTKKQRWVEIDTPDDYKRAKTLFEASITRGYD